MMNDIAVMPTARGLEMLEVWLPLLICIAIGATWYHVLRLRERVVAHAQRLCKQHGLQLLDESVALHRLHAKWRHGALRVTREYRFETSLGGNDRQSASIVMLGERIVSTSMPSRESVGDAVAPAAATPVTLLHPPVRGGTTNNVIPLERARRTLH